MSWLDKIENDLIITTGEGSEFTPLWIDAQKSKEFNAEQFNFVNQPGSLVEREEPTGTAYNLTLYFQGENNIEEAERFWEASNDSRPWVLSHPYYGQLIVQPFNLNYDNREHNVTKVTSEVIETINERGPQTISNIEIEVRNNANALNESSAGSYDVEPGAEEINQMDPVSLQNEAEGNFPDTEAAESYRNAVTEAQSAVAKATNQPIVALKAMQNVIRAPARFEDSVTNRLDILQNQFESLRSTISKDSSAGSKRTFEYQTSANLSAQAEASVTNTNYRNRSEVLAITDSILSNYKTFEDDIVNIQSNRAGDPNSYIPNHDVQFQLMRLINLTVAKLFDMAFDLRQERTFYVEGETNVILLTHKLYGLDPEDQNINALIEQNNFSINELLVIEHGRQVTYYA